MNCDTKKTNPDLLRDDGAREGWCRRCFNELIAGEEKPGKRCVECKVIHMQDRMIEKLVGWLCRGCAKEYEKEVLAMLVKKYA